MGDNKVDLDKLNKALEKVGLVDTSMCANSACPKFKQEAVMAKYPSSVYCSVTCKYSDTDSTHKETYGD